MNTAFGVLSLVILMKSFEVLISGMEKSTKRKEKKDR
jgi:hypothetical protein